MSLDTLKSPPIETLFVKKIRQPSNGMNNIRIIIQTNNLQQQKHRKKIKHVPDQFARTAKMKSNIKVYNNKHKQTSMCEIKSENKKSNRMIRISDTLVNNQVNQSHPYNSTLIVNTLSEYSDCFNPFRNTCIGQIKWRVYRCQLGTQDDSCCCSCNSDAMFEVMKSLYDCYKKKNCDNCNCILCGHLPREERKLGEKRKSALTVAVGEETETKIVKKKVLTKRAEKDMKGKSHMEKENILRDLAKTGAPLPQGKTASEKSLIKQINAEEGISEEKSETTKKTMKKATKKAVKEMKGKTPSEKEKILKELVDSGAPLPKGKTASDKAIIKKVRADLGLPLDTKLAHDKEKITEAEESRKARADELYTQLKGKTPDQKEKILRGFAENRMPLPIGKTQSEKKVIEKVRKDLGLPPEPNTPEERKNLEKAIAAGIVTPLEGKSRQQQQKTLKAQFEAGIPLPEGRTTSEKALIAEVKARAETSEESRKAKADELYTQLKGKTPDQKEKILRGFAENRMPLPIGKTQSEKKFIEKVRKDLGLPPEPTTPEERKNLEKAIAAGIVTPLEGKSKQQQKKTLKDQFEAGIPLPEGRTTSEKSLIAKVKAKSTKALSARAAPSEETRKAKADEFYSELKGKTIEQKEKILRGFAENRKPLPIGKTQSEKEIIEKVRKDLGLPPEPNTPEQRKNLENAVAAGIVTPLEGKTKQQKRETLKAQVKAGIPLPEGRTTSEKSLIAKIQATSKPLKPKKEAERTEASAHELAKFKKLDQKTAKVVKESKGPSDECICGLFQDKALLTKIPSEKLIAPTAKKPLITEVKEEIKRAPSAVPIPSAKLRKAKAAGLLTPLEGKTSEQKERILRGLAMNGILPQTKTASEKKLMNKVRKDLGLPPEPKTAEERKNLEKAIAAGIVTPLEGKSKQQQQTTLKAQFEAGIPLPEGRTSSEKALIAEVKAKSKKALSVSAVPSEESPKAKADELYTQLKGKTPDQKENILRNFAENRVPLPIGKTKSEKKIIEKVRQDLGLPPEPKTPEERKNLEKAIAAGIVTPLEGKSKQQQQKTLKAQFEAGIPLPEGRTPSEKAIIAEVKAKSKKPLSVRAAPSEETRKAKADELYTQLKGKTPDQKEKILKNLAENRVPLPVGKTKSEKKIIDKVRQDLGLPPEPKTSEERKNLEKAIADGIVIPLEGKSKQQQQKTLKAQFEAGIPLPEGRTPSEKAIIAEVKAKSKKPLSARAAPSEETRKAKADELYTQLKGKTPDQKEKILKNLAENRVPLPVGKTKSEKKIIEKVRQDLGLPPEPKTPEERKNLEKAIAAGIVTPLEGKSKQQQQKTLKAQLEAGIPLPEGRTASEKSLIAKVKATTKPFKPTREAERTETPAHQLAKIKKLDQKTEKVMTESKGPSDECICGLLSPVSERAFRDKEKAPPTKMTSEKIKTAKAAGFLTPLAGKTPEQLDYQPKTASEKQITDKERKELGLPPEPRTESLKDQYAKAQAQGLITPIKGKSATQKEKILKAQAEAGIPLPEGRTTSEKSLIAKVKATTKPLKPLSASEKRVTDKERKELGLPPEPRTESLKDQYAKAQAQGLITPIQGKSAAQKEKILIAQAEAGIPLPEGRTTSEKALIAKVKATTKSLKPSSASEKQVTDKERKELGLPPEPRTDTMKNRYAKAQAQGLITPIKGKSAAQKEKILRAQAEAGIPLPEGRTTSEKALIAKVKATTEPLTVPSEKLRKAKAAGLLSPLEGKTSEHKERILRGLAINGILPKAKTTSEKKLINKVRKDLGLPPEPNTSEERKNLQKAIAAGIVTPLEGKSKQQKQKTLKAQFDAGIPLPEGRTSSEKSLIAKIKATSKPFKPTREAERTETSAHQLAKFKKLDQKTAKVVKESKGPSDECICGLFQDKEKPPLKKIPSEKLEAPPAKKPLITEVKEETKRAPSAVPIPSEKLRKAKAAGLLTPLEGKTSEQKERILRGLAINGILPQAKTASEKKLMNKVRKDLGLPPEPKTAEERKNLEKAIAAGIITPLEGKTKQQQQKTLKAQYEAGIPLPEGRTTSEKALIAEVKAKPKKAPSVSGVPPEESRKAKSDELYTQLKGKTPDQKEKILRGFAENHMPLPIGKTKSEKKIIKKVRKDLGLPPEPNTPEERKNLEKAIAAGIVTPLEGKSKQQQQKTLKAQYEAGISLPEGRTTSEKALIAEVKAKPKKALSVSVVPSGESRKAKADELYTQLKGKTPDQQEKILRGFAENRMPLPIGNTKSEKKIIKKVRQDLGLPPEPNTPEERKNLEKAIAAGIVTPLEGKNKQQQQKILKAQLEAGIPLPEGRTPSEKALIAEVKVKSKKPLSVSAVPSEESRKAKSDELYTQLKGKTPEQKEKILRGFAENRMPLPIGKTQSEKRIITKVRQDLGLPPEPKTAEERKNLEKAIAAGIVTPLEGKSKQQQQKTLKAQFEAGIPLPEGRTSSEKSLIAKIKATSKPLRLTREAERTEASAHQLAKFKKLDQKTAKVVKESKGPSDECICGLFQDKEKALLTKIPSEKLKAPAPSAVPIPSEKLRKAKAAGLLTPLEGKTSEQKERILRGLAINGILPQARTASEKKLMNKVRKDLGLPPEPKTAEERKNLEKAIAAGIVTPLEGKSKQQQQKTLKAQFDAGIPLPEGRTTSEKALIAEVKAKPKKALSVSAVPSEESQKAKADELYTQLKGKTPDQKEKILKGFVENRMPLPIGNTKSEKKIIDKVRKDLGLPPEPTTPEERKNLEKAIAAGIVTPLEGKSKQQQQKTLKAQFEAGILLPEGRTPSEKALIAEVKAKSQKPLSARAAPPKETRKAKADELYTQLKGKTPDQKEKILRNFAENRVPLPDGKTKSEKKIIEKVRQDLGLPPEPTTPEERKNLEKAIAAGIVTPLEGKTKQQKRKTLKAQVKAGIPLPEGRTTSEKSLIAKVKATTKPLKPTIEAERTEALARQPAKVKKLEQNTAKVMKESKGPSDECICGLLSPLLTPLAGITPEQHEHELRTASEMQVTDKERRDLGLPPEPRTESLKIKYAKAQAQGLITPIKGKSAAQKDKILKAQAEAGIPLPEGRTTSEKALIAKVKAETKKVSSLVAVASEKLKKPKEMVDTEYGILKAETPSEKEIVRKAKAEGLMSPLTGKSKIQKERILKGLAEAGLPMPEGKTKSDKELIKKARITVGLPAKATESEKFGKIKKKTKKVGEARKLKKVKETGSGYAKVDLSEEYEDIIKTSTCDRGCGCDKKKIRFKHSYVKIRVTSPDISSLCPCPDECVPGVKGGVFVDNEGIKVTVGSAIGVPSFSINNESRNKYGETFSNLSLVTGSFKTPRDSAVNKHREDLKILYKNSSCVNSDYSDENIGQCRNFEEKRQNHLIYEIETNSNNIQETSTSTYLIAYSESVSSSDSDFPILLQCPSTNFHSKFSIDTEDLARTESSLSLLTESSAIGTVSILSLHNSSIISNSSHYVYYHYSRSTNSTYAEDSEYPTNIINYSALDSRASMSDEVNNYSPSNLPFATKPSKRKIKRKETKTRTFVFDMTQSENKRPDEIIKKDPRDLSDENNKPIIVINNLNSEMDVLKMVNEILAKNKFGNSSSIYVVVPTSDDYDTDMSDSVSSTLCINLPKNYFDRSIADTNPTLKSKRELKVRPKSQRALRKAELKTVEKRHRHVSLDTTENALCYSLEELQGAPRLNRVPNTSLLKHILASQGNDQDPKCSLPNYDQTKTQTTAVAVPNIGPKSYKKSADPHIACHTKLPLTPKKGIRISIPVTRHQSRTDKIKQEQSVATQAFGCSLDDSKANREMPKDHGRLTTSLFKEYTLPYNLKKSLSWCELPLNLIGREHIINEVSRNSMNTQIKCFWNNGEKENLPRENVSEKYRSKQNHQVHPSNTRSFGCGPVVGCKTISQLEEARYVSPKYKCIPSSPARVCDIQPCAGFIDFEPTIELKPTIKLKEQLAAINEQLRCLQQDRRETKPPRMISSMSDCQKCTKMKSGDGRPRARETKRSARCGPDCREYREIPSPIGRDQCPACGRQKNELQLPSGCPCEALPKKETANKSKLVQTNSSNFHKPNENACRCQVKNTNKKIMVCECPEDEPELEPVIYYDDREDSKMRSDQTQTTSGFRFKVKKRVPIQEEMSYEEALNYYAEHPDEDVGMGDNCLCLSDGKMINKNCVCDCPYLLDVEPELPEEEPRGLTLHVPGKGTGSKGLAGICCFDKE